MPTPRPFPLKPTLHPHYSGKEAIPGAWQPNGSELECALLLYDLMNFMKKSHREFDLKDRVEVKRACRFCIVRVIPTHALRTVPTEPT